MLYSIMIRQIHVIQMYKNIIYKLKKGGAISAKESGF